MPITRSNSAGIAQALASRRRRRSGRLGRRGSVMIYYLMALIAVSAVASLAVDFGHVALTKTELQSAADAAARAGAYSVAQGQQAVVGAAGHVASCNSADGAPVVLDPTADVQVGTWDTSAHTFTPATASPNAVCVIARRTAARGNPVALAFASLLGKPTYDVQSRAVAMRQPPLSPYGIAGLDHFTSRGVLTVDSYPRGGKGGIASNGDITLNLLGLVGVTNIDGDARPGAGHNLNLPLLSLLTHISGSTAPLTDGLNYPPVSAGAAATANDNAQLPASIFNGQDINALAFATIPSGTYYVRNFTVAAGVSVSTTGPVTIYVTGSTTVLGSVFVSSSSAADFAIRGVGGGPVTLAAALDTYLDLYAPSSPVSIAAGGIYHGRLIGKSIDVLGTAFLHVDETLRPPAGVAAGVALVQ